MVFVALAQLQAQYGPVTERLDSIENAISGKLAAQEASIDRHLTEFKGKMDSLLFPRLQIAEAQTFRSR